MALGAREAAHAPRQLTDARIARNAVSQALAVRSLVKFLGKIGVVIDEGIDGIIDRLMPGPLGIGDDDGGHTSRQVQIAVAGLAWHTALSRELAAHRRLAAANAALTTTPRGEDLPADERHISDLADALRAEAEAEYAVAAREDIAAESASYAAGNAYAAALGRPLGPEDYPDWFSRGFIP